MKIKFPNLSIPNVKVPSYGIKNKVKDAVKNNKSTSNDSGMLSKLKDKAPDSIKKYIPDSIGNIENKTDINGVLNKAFSNSDGILSKGMNFNDITTKLSGGMDLDIDSSATNYLPSDFSSETFDFS